jgi:hypothetical protein
MTASAPQVGTAFAQSLASKDRDRLLGLLASDVDFRAMTPGRFWEASTPEQVVDDVILGHWFEPDDHIEALLSIETDQVADRSRVGYRLRVRNDDGLHLVEQQAYLAESEGRIGWLRIMCAGYRPIEG